MRHLSCAELEAGLEHVRRSPRDAGIVEMIVRRPAVDIREVVVSAELDTEHGLVGDTWFERTRKRAAKGKDVAQSQITVMNSRFADLIAVSTDRWSLAGDQIFADLDLSEENLPAGTRLGLGEAVIEVSEVPHTGCTKFSARFGDDAWKFVNSEVGLSLRLRGINAWVVEPGVVSTGDTVRKV